MNIVVEKASNADINQLVAIQKQAFERLYNLYHDDTSPYLRGAEEFERWFERGCDVYKIYAGDALAGGITIFNRQSDGYYLARLYILPDLQGKGIAKTAIRLCEKNYPHANRWFLDYPEDQLANKRCYEACGYSDTGLRRKINENLTLVDAEKLINGIFQLRVPYLPAALDVIHRSFATVADEFGLTRENCPKHTSFIPIEYLTAQIGWGWQMFGLYEDGKIVGYASLSKENEDTYELHNLAVLPEFRHKGGGKRLVDHAKEKIRELGGSKITIGIIEESTVLKNWYAANGFMHTGTKKFDHLPFTVGFMEWRDDN